MTRQVLFAGMTGIICLVSLLTGSGIGQVYHLGELSMYTVLGLFLLLPFGRVVGSGQVRRREFFLTLAMVLVFAVWPAVKGYKLHGVEYAWLLLLPYVFGQFSLSEDDVRAIGFGAGLVGFAVVASRLFFGIFAGWNKNNIAMMGFLGCAVFSAAPWRTWAQKILHKILLVVMTLMVLSLDSRSCVTGCLILSVFAFGFIKPRMFLEKTWLRRLMLVLPALIAVGVVWFQNSQMFVDLNSWSMQYFNKPIFNGRNILWEHGLEKIRQAPWLGEGLISGGYWHNCAITILTAFGLVGYALWICYFENIMVDSRRWPEDRCLPLCIAAFLSIMIQQSFELGLVNANGSMIPYLIIGIMLGRMRHLRER